MKERKIGREVDITSLVEVTIKGDCLTERDESREAFGFAKDVIGSTRRPTLVNKLAVIVLKCIMNPSLISLDMLALVVPYLFAV